MNGYLAEVAVYSSLRIVHKHSEALFPNPDLASASLVQDVPVAAHPNPVLVDSAAVMAPGTAAENSTGAVPEAAVANPMRSAQALPLFVATPPIRFGLGNVHLNSTGPEGWQAFSSEAVSHRHQSGPCPPGDR